jgi:protein gp37
MCLGDFWDNQVPDEWRTETLSMIRQCRNLDWLILTKRPQNILKMLPLDREPHGWSHVWLRAMVEDMTEARRRVSLIIQTNNTDQFDAMLCAFHPHDPTGLHARSPSLHFDGNAVADHLHVCSFQLD